MPTISKESIKDLFARLEAKKTSLLRNITRGGAEILNVQQQLELINYVLNNQAEITEQLLASPQVGIRLEKNDTDLSTALALTPNEVGELELIAMTNQTLSSGEKSMTIGFIGHGASKDVKLGIRLDTENPEFIAVMKLELGSIDTIQTIIDENERDINAEITNTVECSSSFVVPAFRGPKYQHDIPVEYDGAGVVSKARLHSYVENPDARKGLPKKTFYAINIFAPLGDCNMNDIDTIFTSDEKEQIQKELSAGQVPKMYKKLITDIFQGLADISEKKHTHGDVKLANVFVYRTADGQLIAKHGDLGNSMKYRTQDSIETLMYNLSALNININIGSQLADWISDSYYALGAQIIAKAFRAENILSQSLDQQASRENLEGQLQILQDYFQSVNEANNPSKKKPTSRIKAFFSSRAKKEVKSATVIIKESPLFKSDDLLTRIDELKTTLQYKQQIGRLGS